MKQIINVAQGSSEWRKIRASVDITASEAAAALGLSKYMTRTELLDMKATGEAKPVTEQQEKIFAKGHEVEALARPIIEARICEELYPATITNEVEGLLLLASMDGLTMMQDVGWEHKLFNTELASMVSVNEVPDTHWPQLEQQLLVAECDSIYFTVSDGTEENMITTQYVSSPKRRKQLIEGLKQFKVDLANHEPQAKVEKVEAEPVRDLPAISYKMDGLSLTSNFEAFKQAANELVEKANLPIETDQDFANAEAIIKTFTGAEARIKDLIDRVVGEVQDIDTFTRDLKFIGEQIRQARLATNKQVQGRKEEIRVKILTDADLAVSDYYAEIYEEIKAYLPDSAISIFEAMKGKKNIDSLQNAADTAVAQIKIEAEGYAKIARGNIATIKELAGDYKFLFNDWKDIAFKAPDDFTALVKTRIADHKETERQKEEAQRERIRLEEEAKARAKVEAENKEKQQAEELRQQAETQERERNRLIQQEAEDLAAYDNQGGVEPAAPVNITGGGGPLSGTALTTGIESKTVTGSASRAFIPAETTTVIGGGVQGGVTSAPTNHKQGLSPYQQGYIDGLTAGAHYVDGIWCVNTDHRPLAGKIQEFLLRGKAA